MRNLLKINISDNGEEIFVYGGDDELIMIRSIADPNQTPIMDLVRDKIEEAIN